MVENVILFVQVVLKHWPWCSLPSKSQKLEDWKNKEAKVKSMLRFFQGISADPVPASIRFPRYSHILHNELVCLE